MTISMKDSITMQKAVRFARMSLQTLEAMGPRDETTLARVRLRLAIEVLTEKLDAGFEPTRGED